MAVVVTAILLFGTTPTGDLAPNHLHHLVAVPEVPSWTMLAIPTKPTIAAKQFSAPIVKLAPLSTTTTFHGFLLSGSSTTTGEEGSASSVTSEVSITYSFGKWNPYVFAGATVSGNENYALSREVGAGLKYALSDQLNVGAKVGISNGMKTPLFQKPSMSYKVTLDYKF